MYQDARQSCSRHFGQYRMILPSREIGHRGDMREDEDPHADTRSGIDASWLVFRGADYAMRHACGPRRAWLKHLYSSACDAAAPAAPCCRIFRFHKSPCRAAFRTSKMSIIVDSCTRRRVVVRAFQRSSDSSERSSGRTQSCAFPSGTLALARQLRWTSCSSTRLRGSRCSGGGRVEGRQHTKT